MGKKVITLNSGGMDSLIAIKRLHERGYEQHSVYVDLGQPNRERAKESALNIAEQYCDFHEILTLSSDSRSTFSTSNRIAGKFQGKHKERIPFTDLVFPVIAAVLVVCEDADFLSLGGFKPIPGTPGYNSLAHYNRIDHLINTHNENVGSKIALLQPYEDLGTSFDDVLRLALSLRITKEELGKTISCNSAEPCGYCMKCEMRKKYGIAIN
jgi:7-cyano-7-deazaguanine synthase in queuosine biosynthesis